MNFLTPAQLAKYPQLEPVADTAIAAACRRDATEEDIKRLSARLLSLRDIIEKFPEIHYHMLEKLLFVVDDRIFNDFMSCDRDILQRLDYRFVGLLDLLTHPNLVSRDDETYIPMNVFLSAEFTYNNKPCQPERYQILLDMLTSICCLGKASHDTQQQPTNNVIHPSSYNSLVTLLITQPDHVLDFIDTHGYAQDRIIKAAKTGVYLDEMIVLASREIEKIGEGLTPPTTISNWTAELVERQESPRHFRW